MGELKLYITVDNVGVKRVSGTPISIDSVVINFQQGQSPEEIQRNFPVLSPEQVYGVITYFLSHRKDVEDYLGSQRATWMSQARILGRFQATHLSAFVPSETAK